MWSEWKGRFVAVDQKRLGKTDVKWSVSTTMLCSALAVLPVTSQSSVVTKGFVVGMIKFPVVTNEEFILVSNLG